MTRMLARPANLARALVATLMLNPGAVRAAASSISIAQRPSIEAATRTSDALTVDDLVRTWIADGKEVESWRFEIGAAEFDVITASLLPNPSLVLESLGTPIGRENPPDGVFNLGARLELPLLLFGQRGARRKAALRALDVAQIAVATLIWERASEIRALAIERAFVDEELSLILVAAGELEEIRRIIASRAASGVTPRYDAGRLDVLRASLEAEADRSRLVRDALEARLVAAIASPSVQAAPIRRDSLTIARSDVDESLLLRQALEHRPDLELQRRSQAARLAEADAFRIDARPTPSLFVGTYAAWNDDSINLVGGVSLPIPAFNRNQGLRGRARAEAQSHADMSRALETAIQIEISAGVDNLRQATLARERILREVRVPADNLLERAQRAYKAGVFSIADLLDAHQAVWDSRSKQLELDRAVVRAELELERATGSILGLESPRG